MMNGKLKLKNEQRLNDDWEKSGNKKEEWGKDETKNVEERGSTTNKTKKEKEWGTTSENKTEEQWGNTDNQTDNWGSTTETDWDNKNEKKMKIGEVKRNNGTHQKKKKMDGITKKILNGKIPVKLKNGVLTTLIKMIIGAKLVHIKQRNWILILTLQKQAIGKIHKKQAMMLGKFDNFVYIIN